MLLECTRARTSMEYFLHRFRARSRDKKPGEQMIRGYWIQCRRRAADSSAEFDIIEFGDSGESPVRTSLSAPSEAETVLVGLGADPQQAHELVFEAMRNRFCFLGTLRAAHP